MSLLLFSSGLNAEKWSIWGKMMKNQYEKKTRRHTRRSQQVKRQQERRKRVRIMRITLGVVMVAVLLASCLLVYRKLSTKETPVSTSITVSEYSLSKLIEQVKNVEREQYTPDSMSALEQKIQKAQNVLDNNGSMKEMDEAYMELVIALQDLVPDQN